MKMTKEQINESIASGRLRALSLDTSTIDRKGRRLESGLLLQLKQFRDSDANLVVSDIVEQETISHLTDDAKKAQAELAKGLKSMREAWTIPEERTTEIEQDLIGTREASEIANARWQLFAEHCGMEIAATEEWCDLGELKRRYFAVKPPFEARADKKNEFPDGMALLSLEAWAQKQDTLMLVVTSDKGWMAFCNESEHLVAIEELGDALASFHRHDPGNLLPNISRSLVDPGDEFGIRKAVVESVSESTDSYTFYVEAHSGLGFEEDEVEVEVKEVKIRTEDPYGDVEVVDREEDYLVLRLHADVTADVIGHFSFTKWDSIDREDIPFGSGSASSEEGFIVEILVTISGNTQSGLEIERVEVLPFSGEVHLGEIEPDWMNDPDAYD